MNAWGFERPLVNGDGHDAVKRRIMMKVM